MRKLLKPQTLCCCATRGDCRDAAYSRLASGPLAQDLFGHLRAVCIGEQLGRVSQACQYDAHTKYAVQLWALPEVRGLTGEELEASILEEPEEDAEEAQADAAAADKAEEGRTGAGANLEVCSVLGCTHSSVLRQGLANLIHRACHQFRTWIPLCCSRAWRTSFTEHAKSLEFGLGLGRNVCC